MPPAALPPCQHVGPLRAHVSVARVVSEHDARHDVGVLEEGVSAERDDDRGVGEFRVRDVEGDFFVERRRERVLHTHTVPPARLLLFVAEHTDFDENTCNSDSK